MARFLTVEEFTVAIGLDELSQVAGIGNLNRPEGRTLDRPKIEEAINYSEDLLIGYARARYPVIETLTPAATPNLVKGLISDVARYRLRSRSGGQGQVSAEVQKRHDDALTNMKAVASGKFELPIAGEAPNGEAGASKVASIIAPSPVPSILAGWRT